MWLETGTRACFLLLVALWGGLGLTLGLPLEAQALVPGRFPRAVLGSPPNLVADGVATPVWSTVLLPLPGVALLAAVEGDRLSWAGQQHRVSALGAYQWSSLRAYEPSSAQAIQPLGAPAREVNANTWRGQVEWNLRLPAQLLVGLQGNALAGGLSESGGYDPDLLGGLSLNLGPILRWWDLDNLAFPTQGWLGEARFLVGPHLGPTPLLYGTGLASLARFHRLAPNLTLAGRIAVAGGGPRLAWLDKWAAGGGFFTRGYAWNRFTGDRLVGASVEGRWLFCPDLRPWLGGATWLPLAPGLALELFADSGRAWESSRGLPPGATLAVGGGCDVLLTLNRAPLGRVGVGVSPEGLVPILGFGTAF